MNLETTTNKIITKGKMRENVQKPANEDFLFPGGLPQEHSGLLAGSRYVYSGVKKIKMVLKDAPPHFFMCSELFRGPNPRDERPYM